MFVARGSWQITDVVGDVSALLIGQRVFLAKGHVATDEPRQNRRHVVEVVSGLRVPCVRPGECRRNDVSVRRYRSERLSAMTIRALLLEQRLAANIVVTLFQRSRSRDLIDTLLVVILADAQIERRREEPAVRRNVANDVVGDVGFEAVRRIDVTLHLPQLVRKQQSGKAIVHVGHDPGCRQAQ